MSASKLNESVIVPSYTRKTLVVPYIPLQAGSSKLWERIGLDMPSDKIVYGIKSHEVWQWIESQPVHMWKQYDVLVRDTNDISVYAFTGNSYVFTDEMESWFLLRWS